MDYNSDFTDGKTKTLFGDLHYRHHKGSGKTVIFLHGLGASVLSWTKTVQFLPSNLNVYLIDLLGHGASDAPHINYSVKNQCLALNDLVKAEGLDNIYMIGHSYGGWVTAYYASTNAVKGLVLEDSAGLKLAFDEVVAAKRQQDYKDAFFKSVIEMEGNRDYLIKSILDEEFLEQELDDQILQRITEPTLIIWGAKDILLNPAIGKILHSKIPQSRLEMIEVAGHVPHYIQAKEFVVLFLVFLS